MLTTTASHIYVFSWGLVIFLRKDLHILEKVYNFAAGKRMSRIFLQVAELKRSTFRLSENSANDIF